jgi:hypothetical protein
MTEAHLPTRPAARAVDDEGPTTPLGPAEWLCLAATPTFAIMQLLFGREPDDSTVRPGHGVPPSGMVTMYLHMTALHSPPWVNLICGPAAPQNPASEGEVQPSRTQNR